MKTALEILRSRLLDVGSWKTECERDLAQANADAEQARLLITEAEATTKNIEAAIITLEEAGG